MMSKRDYDALMSGKQLLENNQYTTPIGRSIDLVSGRWDGNRAVVALYEASNILDTRDKDAVEDYIMESSIFLNRLNEKCHIDGYHFDMDDSESGKIYFGKDIDGNREGFNSSEDEVTYSQEAAYFTYLRNKDLCQQRVNRMIEESLILTDDQMAISEKVDKLLIFNEGFGDKIKDGWEKFKAFINKIWNKFLEFISRTINSDKNYLEKYKEIILKREYKANDVEVDDDYHTGVTHISTFQIWSPNVEEIKQIPDGDSDEEIKAVQRLVMKPYAEKSNEDFKDFCLTYFKGGTGQSVTMDKGRIRMENLFDYCYNFDKIRRSIEKNRGIMDKAGNAFIELAKQENAKAAQQNQGDGNPDTTTVASSTQQASTASDTQGGASSTQQTSTAGAAQNSSLASSTQQSQATNDDSRISGTATVVKRGNTKDRYSKYDHTIEFTGSDGNKYQGTYVSDDADPTSVVGSIRTLKDFKNKCTTTRRVNEFFKIDGSLGLISIYEAKVIPNSGSSDTSKVKINSTASNFGNASTGRNMVRSRSGVVDREGALKTITDDQITKRVHKYTNAASTVFASILQAAETIKKDYMQIIKLHVRSYVGETDEERREGKTTAASPHNYGQDVAVGFTPEQLNKIKSEIDIAGDQPDDTTKNRILNMAHDAVKAPNGVPNKTWDSYDALKAEINSKWQQLQQNQNQNNQQSTAQAAT